MRNQNQTQNRASMGDYRTPNDANQQLGVDTELGKERIRAQQEVIRRMAKYSGASSVYEIPTKTSRVDALLHVNNTLYVIEIKTRNSKITKGADGRFKLYDRYGDNNDFRFVPRETYMISNSKIIEGQRCAEILSAQYLVVVYAIHSDNIAYFNCTKLQAEQDYTLKTITTKQPYTNGTETDIMAMLPLDRMRVLKEKKETRLIDDAC